MLSIPVVRILSDLDANMRFNLKHGMWTTGIDAAFEIIQGSKKYTVKYIDQKIKCPTLVLEAQIDDSFPRQPKKVYDALTCPRNTRNTYYLQPKKVLMSIVTAAPSLSNQRIFNWLDETFAIRSS
jgi:hypothetical protein